MTAGTFTNPIVLIGYIIAMALCVFCKVKKCGIVLTAISLAVFVATAAYALVFGADLYKTGAVAAAFFIVNIIPLHNGDGGEK